VLAVGASKDELLRRRDPECLLHLAVPLQSSVGTYYPGTETGIPLISLKREISYCRKLSLAWDSLLFLKCNCHCMWEKYVHPEFGASASVWRVFLSHEESTRSSGKNTEGAKNLTKLLRLKRRAHFNPLPSNTEF